MSESYIHAYALWLVDRGPCPQPKTYGLGDDEARSCEFPALVMAYDLDNDADD